MHKIVKRVQIDAKKESGSEKKVQIFFVLEKKYLPLHSDFLKITKQQTIKDMKKDIHPTDYRPVVFKDMSNGDMFLTRSTCKTKETIEFEGETYPLIKVEISNTSHPFYTGKATLVDTAGRVDKFLSRYAATRKK